MLGTVLVCDDEEINRALLVRLLQRFGYDVIAVSSGAAAIATLRDKHVDLVLLDVQMPGVNGFDICAQLKAAPVHPPHSGRARDRPQRARAQDSRPQGGRR